PRWSRRARRPGARMDERDVEGTVVRAVFMLAASLFVGCASRSLNVPSALPALTTQDVWVIEVGVRGPHDIEEASHADSNITPADDFKAKCADEKICHVKIEPTHFPRLEVVAMSPG